MISNAQLREMLAAYDLDADELAECATRVAKATAQLQAVSEESRAHLARLLPNHSVRVDEMYFIGMDTLIHEARVRLSSLDANILRELGDVIEVVDPEGYLWAALLAGLQAAGRIDETTARLLVACHQTY